MKRATDSQGINIWPDGPALLPFPSAGAVHVWRVWLPPLRRHAARWRTFLTADENARADRFHFDRDRETWLITRGILRTLLARYLDLPASTLEFTSNASGKPALHPRFLNRDLRFNVSHSNQCSLLAFASGIDIGVDVECNQGHRDLEQLGPSILSANDLAAFRRLPSDLRHSAFLAAWTRKEAVLKALGTGFSLSPELVEVTFAPEDEPAIRRAPDLLAPLACWSLHSLDVAEQYSAALAARTADVHMYLWNYLEPCAAS